MSFEREALPDSSSIINPSQMPMREERTVDPYAVRAPRPPGGQQDIRRDNLTSEPRAPEETVKLSPQVAALARREQKFRQEKMEFERNRASLAKEREDIAQYKAMKEKLAAKDYSGLDGLVDYNDYSQYQINKYAGQDPVQERLTHLDKKIADIEKFSEDNANKQFEAAVSERRQAAKQLIDSSQNFPMIKKANAQEAIVHHILDTWENDKDKNGNPIELSIEEAAKEVEEGLKERAREWSALLQDQQETKEIQTAPDRKVLPALKPQMKTLTNQAIAGDLKRPAKPYSLMTNDAERWAAARERALAKLQMG